MNIDNTQSTHATPSDVTVVDYVLEVRNEQFGKRPTVCQRFVSYFHYARQINLLKVLAAIHRFFSDRRAVSFWQHYLLGCACKRYECLVTQADKGIVHSLKVLPAVSHLKRSNACTHQKWIALNVGKRISEADRGNLITIGKCLLANADNSRQRQTCQ